MSDVVPKSIVDMFRFNNEAIEINESTIKEAPILHYSAMFDHPDYGEVGIAFSLEMLKKLYYDSPHLSPRLTLCLANSRYLYVTDFVKGEKFFNEMEALSNEDYVI